MIQRAHLGLRSVNKLLLERLNVEVPSVPASQLISRAESNTVQLAFAPTSAFTWLPTVQNRLFPPEQFRLQLAKAA
jgi:hypothetical protein